MTEAIDHEDDLWILGVSRYLISISALRAALHVVSAGVPRLQTGAIDGGQSNTPLANPVDQCPLEHRVEHPACRCGEEQSPGGLVEGREVWHRPHPDQIAKVRMVGEVLGQSAVVEAGELLQYQAGHQLGLSELLRAVFVPICGKAFAGGIVGDLQNAPRRFARFHILYYVAKPDQVRWFSTEQDSEI
jgi:hypothetical protein